MLRIVNWNIYYQGDTANKVELLNQIIDSASSPCLIALQEVTPSAYDVICRAGLFDSHSFSLKIRPKGKFEGRNRALGCFIGTTAGIDIIDSSLVERALFPERAITANVQHGHFVFEIVCFHSLTGVHYKKAKSAQFAALADYLYAKANMPLILCCDLNEPKMDYWDPDKIEFFDQKGDKGKYAGYILQPGTAHEIRDIYRTHLFQTSYENTHESDMLIPERFAASHILTGGIRKRYDYIMASHHWTVKDVRYLYDEAIQHGSDHAMVVGDLALYQ